MNSDTVIQFISLILFTVCAYYIKKSEACPCPDADASKRQYILYFSYFSIAHLIVMLSVGNLFIQACLSFPVLFIIPLFALIGGLVWAIFTLQHVYAMRKCRCPDSIAQEFTYGFAIIRIVAWMILTLSLGYIGYLYASFSNSERKEFKKAFMIAFNKRIN
jgi:cytochrome bd-type quinol oxidase subunit 2